MRLIEYITVYWLFFVLGYWASVLTLWIMDYLFISKKELKRAYWISVAISLILLLLGKM